VILGGLTGNDWRFLASVYRNGGRRAFDGVAVHTDTACNIAPPGGYLRDRDGRINQFSFLAYKEVRRVMAARGDRRKGIWMTEMGWSTSRAVCDQGRWAGLKAGGVSESLQARYTTQALRCLSRTSYVRHAMVFRLRDEPDDTPNGRHGLLRPDGSPKPAFRALRAYARRPGRNRGRGSCGDFSAPTIRIQLPRRGKRFPKSLPIRVSASDRSRVSRITLLCDGRKIRNFEARPSPITARGFIDWQGAKRLSPGRHRITVVAYDGLRNTARRSVTVVKTRG